MKKKLIVIAYIRVRAIRTRSLSEAFFYMYTPTSTHILVYVHTLIYIALFTYMISFVCTVS